MSPPTAGFADPARAHRRRCVLDASVLYQELIRNLLLWVAAEGGLDPFWTERILDETRRNLIGDGVLEPEQWERLRAAMLSAFPDAMLDQPTADAIEHEMPNDEKDRHVLAAAVAGNVELVITNNLRHFEAADLEEVGKQALSGTPSVSSRAAAIAVGALSRMSPIVPLARLRDIPHRTASFAIRSAVTRLVR